MNTVGAAVDVTISMHQFVQFTTGLVTKIGSAHRSPMTGVYAVPFAPPRQSEVYHWPDTEGRDSGVITGAGGLMFAGLPHVPVGDSLLSAVMTAVATRDAPISFGCSPSKQKTAAFLPSAESRSATWTIESNSAARPGR